MMKKILLMCFSFGFAISVWAQNRVVTGKVTSKDDGSSLPGVNVVLKGSTAGTVSDGDGNFSINVPSGESILTFSFIGYKTEEVKVGDKTVIDLVLTSDASQLDEVVVTGIAVPTEQKRIGTSIAKVGNELINYSRVPNSALALSGKVSGLQINQTDNGINNAPRIVLRGNRSILGNNQALIVLDGMPVDNAYINSINPLDIDNISVLKGAAASAIYGSFASNGVLLYTTKTGAKNKAPEINYSSNTQLEQINFLPHLQTQFGLNGGEAFNSASSFTIDPNFSTPYTAYENQSYGPAFNGALVPLGYPLANGQQNYTTYSPKYNDHLKFWNTGVTSQNDISVTTSTDRGSVHFSFQDMNRSGVTPGDKYRRDIFRVNGTTQYGKFKFNYRTQYTQGDQNVNFAPAGNRTSSVYWAWMNVGMHVPLTTLKDWRNNPLASPSGYYDDFYPNPYWLVDNNRRSIKTSEFIGLAEPSYQATKWLNLTARFGLTARTTHQSDRNGPIYFDPNLVNPISSRLNTPGTVPAGVVEAYTFQKRFNLDAFATIDHNFTQDLSVRAIIGGNVYDDFVSGIGIASATLQPFLPTIYNLNYRNGNLSGGNGEQRTRRLSAYIDAGVTYKALTVHGSYRTDQISLLAQNNRTFSYPEIDAAFVLSDAFPALFDNKIINYAKITGSYAHVGNVNIGPYGLQNVFSSGNYSGGNAYSLNGSVPVIYQGQNQIAQNLKPEFTFAREVTAEAGFLANRITLGVAYYSTNTTNQTLSFGVSPTAGYTNALINTGEMESKGLEYDFKVTPLQTTYGLKWTIGANYTDLISNKVLSLYTPPGGTPYNQIQVTDNGGGLVNALSGGLFPTGNVTSSYAIVGSNYAQLQTTDFQRDPQGHVVVDPITGNPIRATGIHPFGQTNPQHRLGLSNTISWKGFQLYVLFDYRAGYVIYNQLGRDIEFSGIGYQSAAAGRQPFVFPNSVIQNPDGSYSPNKTLTVPEGNVNFWTGTYGQVGAPYVTKGDFWKLREISLRYQIPQAILSKTKVIKNATVSLTGRNLLMWRPKSNQWTDPEFSGDNSNANGTTTAFQTPPTKLYGLNLSLTF
ncbi:MAG: SusC/RagA family TonB-linked outer membrane protein [Bacteroidetes bacterium]|nr:SusC/RagA family TonB-linked outer membrane protein [Bacteroidota bacterium]MBS1539596.1 SusC/RagA family TonB-linked outer membrane protein [Bacteroidota bacterium]